MLTGGRGHSEQDSLLLIGALLNLISVPALSVPCVRDGGKDAEKSSLGRVESILAGDGADSVSRNICQKASTKHTGVRRKV